MTVTIEKVSTENKLITIPPMTDPLGEFWNQPKTDNIIVDDKHALMSSSDCKKLMDYSMSSPSGAYVGKMWKSHTGSSQFLHWYDFSDKPDQVMHMRREIILID